MKLTPAKVTLIMFFVVGGLIAAYVAKVLLARDETPPPPRMRNVPMSLADLSPGTVITEAHVGLGRIPESDLEPDMLLNNRVIVGRVVKNKIAANSSFKPQDLYPPGEFPPLEVEKGMRAVTVAVRESSNILGGLLKPGQFVDVHMTFVQLQSDPRLGKGMTMTLFKGIRVLAVNQSTSGGIDIDPSRNTVTLELTPAQANVMLLAQEKGLISLTFNPEGPGDGGVAVSDEDRTTLEEILGLEPEVEPEEEPSFDFEAEAYRGGGRDVLFFLEGRRVNNVSRNDRTLNRQGTSAQDNDNYSDPVTVPQRDPAPAPNQTRDVQPRSPRRLRNAA